MNKVIGIEKVNGGVVGFKSNTIFVKPICYDSNMLNNYIKKTQKNIIIKNNIGISLIDILNNINVCFAVTNEQFKLLNDVINDIDADIYKECKSNSQNIKEQIDKIEQELLILKDMLKIK